MPVDSFKSEWKLNFVRNDNFVHFDGARHFDFYHSTGFKWNSKFVAFVARMTMSDNFRRRQSELHGNFVVLVWAKRIFASQDNAENNWNQMKVHNFNSTHLNLVSERNRACRWMTVMNSEWAKDGEKWAKQGRKNEAHRKRREAEGEGGGGLGA